MFSRTTIASSISRPTHSDSAISVIMLIVKPNMYMNRNVPISAIGSVSPVMTVERQELRNRKTIRIVSSRAFEQGALARSRPRRGSGASCRG